MKEKQFRKFISEEEIELKEQDIEQFREEFEDSIIRSGQLLAILSMTRARESVHLEGYFKDDEDVERFGEYVNRFGVNCFTDHSLDKEETMLHSISKLFDDEESNNIDKVLGNAEKTCNVFLTTDKDHGMDDVKEIARLREKDNLIKYHRKFGEFLHYPEEDIESFIFNQRPEWKKKLLKLIGHDVPPAISVDKAAEKYSNDMSRREKKTLNSFIDHTIRNTEASFQRTMSEAKNRRETVDKYTDAEKLVDDLLY